MAPGVASSKRRAPFQREAHFLSGHRAQARGAGLPSFSSSPGATTTNYLACPCWIPEVGSASEDNHVSARCTQLIPSVPQGTLVPRLVHSMTAQNDRLPISNARRGLASTPRAWSIETGQCSGTRPPPGAVSPVQKARSEGRALKHERSGVEGLSSVLVTSQ